MPRTWQAAHPAASGPAATPMPGVHSSGSLKGMLLFTGGAGQMHTAMQPQTSADRSGSTSVSTGIKHVSQPGSLVMQLWLWAQVLRRLLLRRRLTQTRSACCGGRPSSGCRCQRRRRRSGRRQLPRQPSLPARTASPADPSPTAMRPPKYPATARGAAATGVRRRRSPMAAADPVRHLQP